MAARLAIGRGVRDYPLKRHNVIMMSLRVRNATVNRRNCHSAVATPVSRLTASATALMSLWMSFEVRGN